MFLMPELPEVQTIVSQLAPALTGARIESVRIVRGDIIRQGRRELTIHGPGSSVVRVDRTGKRLIFHLTDAILVVHLGMSGRLTLEPNDAPIMKHTHLRIRFHDRNDELRFRDPRRFGGVWFIPNPAQASRKHASRAVTKAAIELSPLGPDALSIQAKGLREVLRRRRQIKALLLDQRAISGLGNIYCDEALHRAGIHPITPASELTAAQIRQLAKCIRATLRSAIRAGGSTLRDYRDADGAEGWFQVHHRVYGREGKPCQRRRGAARCGALIERARVAGRSTHTCPNCQPTTVRR